ncbi:MAG: MATE family efflux transporter [Geminicoccaceae bacterium]
MSRRGVQHELAALLRLALPVMSSRAGLLVMTTVDTVMTGWAGGAELAYLALGLAPFIFLMLVGTGLLTGTVVLVAQTHGAGEASACGRIWHLAMINAALAGVLSIAMLGHAEWFLDAFGQTPTMAAHGAEVARMFGLGMPAMLGFVATTLFLEGLGRPQIGVVVITVGNLLNVPLNWLFIYGAFDWPPTGAAGAALATSVVRWLMLLAIVGYAVLAPGVRACGSVGGPWPTWRLQVRLLRLGIPFAVSQGLETSAFQSLTLFCGWLGETQLAAYQIAINVTAMVYMATVGLATATAIRVGRGIGGGEPGKAITAAWLGVGATLLVMLVLAPAVAGGAPWLAALFTTDVDVQAVATRCLTLVAPIIVADGLQGVLSGALRGAADVWVPMAIHVASFWLVLVPAAWLLGFSAKLGIDGLLWGILLGLSVAATLLVWRLVLLPPHRLQRA